MWNFSHRPMQHLNTDIWSRRNSTMAKQQSQSVQERLFDSIQDGGDLKTVEFCLKNGAKINAKDQRYGRSSLYLASKHGTQGFF